MRSHYQKCAVTLIVFLVALLFFTRAYADPCSTCHQDQRFKTQNKKLYDYFKEWQGSPHDLAGVSCAACHGGHPDEVAKEKAHAGILPASDAASKVHFKNVPQTCGTCHDDVLNNFVESKHYRQLKDGNGPSCVTCHGSVSAKAYYASILLSTCTNCHNQENKNHPEIIELAEKILNRLNASKGYRHWASLYFKTTNQQDKLKDVNALYGRISDGWHRFNLSSLDQDSEKLLNELKLLFKTYREDLKGQSQQD